MKIKYYPINLNLTERRCVVVGGGKVAERKAKRLLSSEARVTVIAPFVTNTLKSLAKKGKISIKKRNVKLSDLKAAYLVISASDNRAVNSAVYRHCKKDGILINVVDSPKECDFILPSIVTRGGLTITISTSGLSPALAKDVRKKLEKSFGPEYAAFLKIMEKLRPRAIKRFKTPGERKKFFEKIVNSNALRLLKRGKTRELKRKLGKIVGAR